MAKYYDAQMLARSKLQHKLDQMISQDSGLCVYGNAGYVGNFPWVTSALRCNQMHSNVQRRTNRNMSSARIVVEWGFGKVIKYVY